MRKQLVLAALMAAAPFAAPAQALSYNYVEAGYATIEKDLPSGGGLSLWTRPDDLKADGFFVGGSFAVSANVYLFADLRRGTDNVHVVLWEIMMGMELGSYDVDANARQTQFGVGYRHGVSESVDLLAEIGGLSYDVELEDDTDRMDMEGTDLRASVGVRAGLGSAVEGWAKAHYTDEDFTQYGGIDERSGFSFTGGLQYKFTPMFGVVGEYEAGDGDSQYKLGVRASF